MPNHLLEPFAGSLEAKHCGLMGTRFNMEIEAPHIIQPPVWQLALPAIRVPFSAVELSAVSALDGCVGSSGQ